MTTCETCKCGKSYEEHRLTWKEKTMARGLGVNIKSAREFLGEAACDKFSPEQRVEIEVSE